METKTLPVVVGSLEPTGKQARSSVEHFLRSRVTEVIDLEVAAVAEEIGKRVRDITEALSGIDLPPSSFQLEEVTFTLAITSAGKVALLSAIEGSASSQVGLQFTLTRKVTDGPS